MLKYKSIRYDQFDSPNLGNSTSVGIYFNYIFPRMTIAMLHSAIGFSTMRSDICFNHPADFLTGLYYNGADIVNLNNFLVDMREYLVP